MNGIILSKEFAVPTKTDITNQAQSLIAQVKENEVQALKAYAIMTALEKLAEDVKKAIAEKVVTEHESYGQKIVDAWGVTFERSEVGVKYDYSEDDEWKMLQDNIDAIKIEQKARELILKETGRCGKSSTTAVKVKLAK